MSRGEVLVPLDGSPLAERALERALELFDRPVTVMNVVTPLDSGMSEGGVLSGDGDRREEARERAELVVAAARDRAAADGREVRAVVVNGDPADAILEYVETHDVDHVVMGSHGGPDAGLAERLMGTVSTKVVAESPVSVTVIR